MAISRLLIETTPEKTPGEEAMGWKRRVETNVGKHVNLRRPLLDFICVDFMSASLFVKLRRLKLLT